ncbi:hypothetical protein [Brevibacterium sp.]|uniref:hypothetical protein n=1 Tax=Brevibacterium sp. TaxID=1701 RepID=UPI0025BE809B|nr:hypothetical protein [Brevibacterium sp.]
MPEYIIKPSRDEDFYAVYSTVVDSFTIWGTRAQLESVYDRAEPQRFERADWSGSSALWPSPDNPALGWGDERITVREGLAMPDNALSGTVRRERIREFCETADHSGVFHPPEGMVEWQFDAV